MVIDVSDIIDSLFSSGCVFRHSHLFVLVLVYIQFVGGENKFEFEFEFVSVTQQGGLGSDIF